MDSDPLEDGLSQRSHDGPARLQPPLWNIPNQLTVARLLLSAIFFVLLAAETHRINLGLPLRSYLVNLSMLLFVLAVITDFLDGYLARKWGLTSTFGRIADPFADKIVICGGFVMLTGLAPRLVEPWFAVVILVREFLVSGLRSFLESRGVAFGAAFLGKLKMVAQSVAIPLVLFYVANLESLSEEDPNYGIARGFFWFTVASLALTLILTIGSSVGYLRRASQLLAGDSE